MKYSTSAWQNITCNECKGTKDVKVIEVGSNGIFLCGACRADLIKLLKEDNNINKEEKEKLKVRY